MKGKPPVYIGGIFLCLCYLTVIDCTFENRIVNSNTQNLEVNDFLGISRGKDYRSHRKRRNVLPDISIDVNENATVGYSIYGFNNTQDYRYVMRNYNPRFEVIDNKVIVKDGLDYETSPDEIVEVVFWDANQPSTSNEIKLLITVLDINEPPEWTMEYEPYLAVTTQNVVNDVKIYMLSARDPEDPTTELVYGLFIDESNMFAVDPETGEIYIDKQPGSSFIEDKEYVLTVTVSEKDDQTLSNAADIKVKVGMRPPQFTRELYSATISEESIVPVELITVKAKSFDYSETVTYSIEEQPMGTNHRINPDDGEIILVETLDRELFTSYTLKIKATDSNGETISVVHVTEILDVNDNVPVFSQFVYAFRNIPENIGLDTPVGTVEVTDKDGDLYGSVLLSVSNGVPFRVNENGTIYPTAKLDYESNPTYNFIITAVDLGGKTSTANVQVDLQNINDMSPQFSRSNYTFDVDDTVNPGYKINTIYATDPDGDSVTFRIESCNQCLFSIDPFTGVISRSDVPGDLSEASYSLTVVATDDGSCCSDSGTNFAEAAVTISINDINDNAPVFPNCNTYAPSIQENSPRGSSVLLVTATDSDSGVNGIISFDLVENDFKRGYFQIETLSSGEGLLKTIKNLDRELDETFSLTLLAEDNAVTYGLTGFCQITVTVTDENDEYPSLQKSSVTIQRSMRVNSIVTKIEAFDPDLEDQNGLRYTLEEPSNEFLLDLDGTLWVKSSLENAPEVITLKVTATDAANQDATAEVKITIIDNQVGAPAFTAATPNYVNVSESTAIGTTVFKATAESPDSSQILYIIIIGNTPQTNNPRKFQIDGTSGEVTVHDILDYEVVKTYELLIQAKAVNTELAEYKTVVVNIEDTNDRVPEFDLSAYVANIVEGDYSSEPKEVVTVHAEDSDTKDDYPTVRYFQSPKSPEINLLLFNVHPTTGLITTDKVFDRENTTRYVLYVVAEDGAPSARPSVPSGEPNTFEVTVTVQIIDKNDNPPMFAEQEYTTTVAESVQIGYIVTQQTATDKDEDSVLNYLIAGGTTYPGGKPYQNAVFEAEETGIVRVAASLDYETVERYELDYVVTDGLHENVAKLIITIQDTNDNKPVFDQPVYPYTIQEGPQSSLGVILTVSATDGDADSGTIRYSLDGHDSTIFSIDSLSGDISLLQYLDYEMKPAWHFIVEATDEDGLGQTGLADVIITVDDLNDNPPEFNEAEYEGLIEEGTGVRYVMTVRASDADSPANSNNLYQLIDDAGTFTINNDGEIFTRNVELDRESIPDYIVVVKATDPDDTSMSATATATIIVTDVNDEPPVFNPKTYSVSVPESLNIGDEVLEIFATDADTGVNAELEFTFLSGNEGSTFQITRNPVNKQNAVIYLASELDYETLQTYNLQIQASDQVHFDTATATIHVTNVNEAPEFTKPVYSLPVLEGDILTPFITVSATDPESDSIRYAIDPTTNSENWLTIDETTGVITQIKEFDREAIPLHNFIVLAVDDGNPAATGSCTVEVTVTDVNDECPQLIEDYKPTTMENQKPPQLVETITAFDPDITGDQTPYAFSVVNGDENGGEYTVNQAFSLTSVSDTSARIETKVSLDREAQKFYYMQIETKDKIGNSCTTTVTIEVGDENDNPHQSGEKSMAVYTYEGGTSTGVGSTPVGPVNAPDLDDDDLDEKTFKKLPPDDSWIYFDLDTDSGIILIKEGTPDGIYEMEILVSDGGVHPDQTSTVTVTVTDLPEEAVYNSGSMRMSGDSAAGFVRGPDSTYANLRKTLSEILGTAEENVDIFSVMDVEGETDVIDVRYSAHGSPYYKAERLDMAVRAQKGKVESATGLQLIMIKIDACFMDEGVCEGSCYNNFTVTKEPYLIDLQSQSFTGITTYTTAACGCAGTDVFPDGCSYDACMNGGTCTSTIDGFSCTCPQGFEGGRCEMIKRNFEGSGSYAWVETLEQCEETITSIEFITASLNGILFYNGPMQSINEDPSDFILLELVNGRPRLKINLGDQTAELSFGDGDLAPLNDDVWHTIEIRRNVQDIKMVVDHCKNSVVINEENVDTTPCIVNGSIQGNSKLLNVNTPLQLGGVDQSQNWEYPPVFTASGFNGCIRNLIQDGKLYDLSDNNVGASFQKSQEGCPRTDDSCIDNDDGTSWCVNGTCDANTKDSVGKCICYPGYTGERCDQETTPYDFALNSYVDYTVKAAAGLDSTGFEEHYHSMVRTWRETGLVWYIANLDTGEHTTIDIVDGSMRLRYNLGDGEFMMSLPNYRINNGQWHSVEYDRYGNYVTLKVDRGGGTRQVEGSPGSFQLFVASPESLRVGDSVQIEVIQQDFQGCMNDPRINNNFIGFETSIYADLTSSNNITEGCVSDACDGVTCPAPTNFCHDYWRRYECICPPNTIGDFCTPLKCDPNPCKNGGTCIEDAGGVICICPDNYKGDRCENEQGTTIGENDLSPAIIAVICVCLLFLLIVLIIMLLYKNRNLRREKAMLVYENDDLAENLAYYDEEGGGEEDHDGYDINTLSKPVDRIEGGIEKSRLIEESEMPLGNANEDPSLEVANLLDDRLPKVDGDPDNSPYDSLHLYDYEGEGSTAGSLSSINTVSTDGSQDFDYLNSLGQPFKRLADLYGGGED